MTQYNSEKSSEQQTQPHTQHHSEASQQSENIAMYRHFHQVKDVIQGVEAIDYFFAKEMLNALVGNEAINPIAQSNLNHLFLALSAGLRAGHSCLPLVEIADQHWGKSYSRRVEQSNSESASNSQEEESSLSHAGFIFSPLPQLHAMLTELNISESDNQLVVYKDNNLYLRRYFQFETDLGKAINSRLSQTCHFDNDAVAQCISKLFPNMSEDHANQENNSELDWQKIAVANAINKNFSVIAGGPGTGKTYTVTKLLAALVMLQQEKSNNEVSPNAELNHAKISHAEFNNAEFSNGELSIALVAPTGKAAQRLSESIVNAVEGFKGLIKASVLEQIPTQAQTIHRLLGVIPNSPNFKHQEDNVLPYDIVLIDEVSMVDLPLMTRLFRALKPSAKVILLGDADQLPSVAAGSVLADIAPRPHGGYSPSNNKYLSAVCQLNTEQLIATFSGAKIKNTEHFDYLTFLVKSRRFDGQGGIGLLANSVINGDTASSWQLLCQSQTREAQNSANSQLSLAQGDFSLWLAPLVKQYYQPIEFCKDVKEAFALLSQFRVLCATRQGEQGVEQMNELIKSYLGKNNSPYQQSQQALYHGQPIMINENDYRLGLYNGDIGIIWRITDQEGKTHLMACFEDTSLDGTNIEATTLGGISGADAESSSIDGTHNSQSQQGIRKIIPSRLPKFESVYAMTIHKTQGSEFSHVAMAISATQAQQQGLQERGSKLLSRELLYTGITRAKKQLTIAANQRVWQQGVTAKVQRHSGLHLYDEPEK